MPETRSKKAFWGLKLDRKLARGVFFGRVGGRSGGTDRTRSKNASAALQRATRHPLGALPQRPAANRSETIFASIRDHPPAVRPAGRAPVAATPVSRHSCPPRGWCRSERRRVAPLWAAPPAGLTVAASRSAAAARSRSGGGGRAQRRVAMSAAAAPDRRPRPAGGGRGSDGAPRGLRPRRRDARSRAAPPKPRPPRGTRLHPSHRCRSTASHVAVPPAAAPTHQQRSIDTAQLETVPPHPLEMARSQRHLDSESAANVAAQARPHRQAPPPRAPSATTSPCPPLASNRNSATANRPRLPARSHRGQQPRLGHPWENSPSAPRHAPGGHVATVGDRPPTPPPKACGCAHAAAAPRARHHPSHPCSPPQRSEPCHCTTGDNRPAHSEPPANVGAVACTHHRTPRPGGLRQQRHHRARRQPRATTRSHARTPMLRDQRPKTGHDARTTTCSWAASPDPARSEPDPKQPTPLRHPTPDQAGETASTGPAPTGSPTLATTTPTSNEHTRLTRLVDICEDNDHAQTSDLRQCVCCLPGCLAGWLAVNDS